MTTSKDTARELREILDGDPRQRFEQSGCSDHVSRRNLRVTVAIAAVLLVVLIALLIT